MKIALFQPEKIEKMADFCGFAAVFFVPKKWCARPTRRVCATGTRNFIKIQPKVFWTCAELRVRGIIRPRKEFVGGISHKILFVCDDGGCRVHVCVWRCVCQL